MNKAPYMLDKATREIYAWSPTLAENPDKYIGYFDALPKVGPDGLRRAFEGCEFEESAFVSKASDPKNEERYAEERLDKLVNAMKNIAPIEFATANNMPKLNVLEKVTGFLPSIKEREIAFARYKIAKTEESK